MDSTKAEGYQSYSPFPAAPFAPRCDLVVLAIHTMVVVLAIHTTIRPAASLSCTLAPALLAISTSSLPLSHTQHCPAMFLTTPSTPSESARSTADCGRSLKSDVVAMETTNRNPSMPSVRNRSSACAKPLTRLPESRPRPIAAPSPSPAAPARRPACRVRT